MICTCFDTTTGEVTSVKTVKNEAEARANTPPKRGLLLGVGLDAKREKIDVATMQVIPRVVEADPEAEQVAARRAVNRERDRRIIHNFWFEGRRYDYDPESRRRIQAAGLRAGSVIWIDADNRTVAMTPDTVIRFVLAALDHEDVHIHAARRLKDMNPIPDDYTDDKYWRIK